MLTGAIQSADFGAGDVRGFFPRFGEGAFDANARLVAEIGKVAQACGASAAQVAPAWVHSRADVHGLTSLPFPATEQITSLHQPGLPTAAGQM